MIHKFERIVSIGKFRDYQATGTVSFNKLTVVYAENGSGKTTLASLLRSLSEDKPSIVTKRLTINSTATQAAQIIQKDANNQNIFHTFRPANGWSNRFSNIEIFDIHFINQNIYTGFEFNEEHRRQLHEFVIGSQGVAIKQQIEANKHAKTASRQNQEQLSNDIVRLVGFGLTPASLTAFTALEALPDAENLITAAQIELGNARASQAIRQLPILDTIELPSTGLDFASINSDLQTTIETIRDITLEELFDQHCSDLRQNGMTENQRWLRDGHSYLNRKINESDELSCPFCKQEITADLDIIRAYTQKFNQAFNDLVSRLQGHLDAVTRFNPSINSDLVERITRTNATRMETWRQHLSTISIEPTFAARTEGRVSDLLSNVLNDIRTKLSMPSVLTSIDASNFLEAYLRQMAVDVRAYNDTVRQYNQDIQNFLNSIPSEQVATEAFNALNRQRLRHTPAIAQMCTDLDLEKQNLRNLEAAYPGLVQQQENAVTAFLTHYCTQINDYLTRVFRTPFLVDDVRHVAPQGRATQSKLGYRLTLNGSPIQFDTEEQLNAKDCLSEGDKSTIALAFFLAKLDIDPDLQNKVVVIDDPLSSFDSNRRLYTVQVLNQLKSRVKQLVVLSHNEFFLYEIFRLTERRDRKALVISNNAVTNSSAIRDLDIEKLVEHDYFKHIQELRDFLNNADLTKKQRVLGLIRNVLESHIKFKFYNQVAGLPENQRTFGNLIDELVNQSVVFRDQPNHGAIISKLRLLNGVSCEPHHGEATPDYLALGVDPNTITATELQNLVLDTFQLIDSML